jgi:hypothetical protein
MKSMFRKGSDYGDTDTGTEYENDGEECGDINCKANRYLPSFTSRIIIFGFSHHYTTKA